MMKKLMCGDSAREIANAWRRSWLARVVAMGLITASLSGSLALNVCATPQLATQMSHMTPATTHLVADSGPTSSILGGPGMP